VNKTIAIDIGQVIMHFQFDGFLTEFTNQMIHNGKDHFSKNDAWNFLDRTQRLHDLALTLLADELKYEFDVNHHTFAQWRVDRVVEEWNKSLVPNQYVVSWIEGLLDQGVKVALLSNIGIEHAKLMPKLLGSKIYDNSIRWFSCDVGARKPTPIYYHTFLSLYPEFKGCIYLDDNLDNVKAGRDFEFNTIEFNLEHLKIDENIKNKLMEINALI
jgi:FMN phosphatase YigB (HAD superfamily)